MASLSGWTEIMIWSLLFVAVFTGILVSMNSIYQKNYGVSLTNSSYGDLVEYQETFSNQLKGDVSFDSSSGLTLKSSWEIITSAFNMIAGFLTGSFITSVVGITQAGVTLAFYLRILWFLSLAFIILKILFKVNA